MFYRCELWQNHVSEGCYPDCDMLPLGKVGKVFGNERMTRFTEDEQKTMMTLWSLFGSPMMIGAELTMMDDFTLSLLTNKEVLAMLTPKCKPLQIRRDENEAIWSAYNEETNDRYIALFNLSDEDRKVVVDLDSEVHTEVPASATELWTGSAASITGSTVSATLKPHACVVYKF